MADEHQTNALAYFQHTYTKMPCFDRLAARTTVFSNAYTLSAAIERSPLNVSAWAVCGLSG